jgi:UDP-N-acetylmuramyl pentapeptide synthase
VLWYGTGPEDHVRAEGVEVDRTTGRASFDLVTPAGRACVLMPAPGEHLVADALAAAAVGAAFEIDPEETARAISAARISGGRMEEVQGVRGLRVINDAYNANPTSTAAALRAARWMAADGRCVAVLGLMAELGPIAVEEHERIGELVARLGFDALVVVGAAARRIAVGAEREGVEPERIVVCEGPAEAVEAVNRLAGPGDVVLVKGSRAARLERVVESLRAPATRLKGGAG